MGINISYAQLLYEGMVFDGMDRPLLDNASSVSVSPDGNFVYTTSFNDNAVSVYSRDVSGSLGSLTFVEAHKNEVGGIVGINGTYHLKISPDGNHVYVAGSEDHAVAVFNRNAIDGTLTYMTTYWNNVDGIEGMEGAAYIDMPSDGNHVYIVGSDENAVAVFQRNVLTGTLSFVEMIQDESGDVSEMNFPLSLMASPDGKHIYVTSFGDNAINVFSRNLITGALTFVEHHKDDTGGVSGLIGAYAPYVTPDGLQVYVSGLDDDAIVAFNRDPISGELSYVNTYVDNVSGVDGISGPTAFRVSNDGNYLFAAGSNEDAVSIFSRNADSGTLSFISIVQEGVNGVSGISYPIHLDISEDGNNLYVAGFASASLAVFDINESTGALSFQNAETGNGQGVSGLDGSTAVTVSPDGNFVYAAGNNDDAIVVFQRDENSGMLTYVQKIEDSASSDGLNGINCIAISPDGNYAYATGFWDKSVVLFQRNNTTGVLTYIERYKDGISGVDGLNGANFITISPDGNNAYVTGFWEHAVAMFSRNAVNGKLTFVEVFKDGVLGVDGLNRANGVEVSPDGKTVYVSGSYDNAIAIFERNESDGALTYLAVVEDGVDSVDGIQRINSIVVSPNNLNVYASGLNDDAVAIFNRDPATGLLSYSGQIKNGVGDIIGLDGPSRLAMSENGEHIYITSTNDDAIIAMRRNVSTGELLFEGAVFDSDSGINGLDGASYVAVSPDGKHMYAASTVDDAVAVFSCTYIFEMNEVICQGDSVVIGSNVYLESGTYIDTFNFGACKSVSTLDLVVQPALTVLDVEICNGDNYFFNGLTYNQTGSHDANLTSSYGCDSTVTLNLTVVNEFSDQFITASICQGETYPGGYTTTGVYTNTYTTGFGCDSTVVLDLTVNPTYEQTIDAEICEGDFYVLGTQNYIATGTFVESFSTAMGCDSIITLNLTVVSPYVTMNETICDGETYTLGQNSFTEAGTYNFTLESGSGCNSEVTLHLIVNDSPLTNLVDEICEGDTYTVGATTYTETGVYTNILAATNGCDSTVVLDLTVNATSTELTETICEGDSYTVGTSTFTTTGVFSVVMVATSGCGDSTIVLDLTVQEGEINQNAMICDGESFSIGSDTYTETGMYTGSFVSGAGCNVDYTLDLLVADVYNIDEVRTICPGESVTIGTNTYTETGNYTDVLTSSMNCDSTINLNLTVLMPVDVTESITDDEGDNSGAIDLTVSGGMSPYTFDWSNGASTEDISDLTVGVYTVSITDANGCTSSHTFEVDQVNNTFEVDTNISINAYPNPATAGGFVNLSFDIGERQTLKIQLLNSVGQMIKSERIDFLSGNTVHAIKLPKVQGLYQLYIETEEGKFKTIQISVK